MTSSRPGCDSNRASVPVIEGQVVGGRYEIRAVIAQGGMGVICEALHRELGVPVAVKFIRSDLADNPEIVERFLNEARAAAALKSEHIARVYDAGRIESGEPYLVMERLEGTGFDALLKEHGSLDASFAVDLILQACEGLAEAHAVGLVHRDIKPANLFVTRRPDGRPFVKILDFGISKRLVDGHRKGLTDPRVSVGSPWYMSPEQMRNAASVNQRTDIWSLGIVLYELLTGAHPFDGETITEVCAKVLTDPTPSLRSRLPEADVLLDGTIARCLSKDPEQRYATVSSLADDLASFRESGEGSAVVGRFDSTSISPIAGEVPAAHSQPRSGALAAITGLLFLGIGACAGYALEAHLHLDALREWPPVARVSSFRWSLTPALNPDAPADPQIDPSWSPAPFVPAGAVSAREVVVDRAGGLCVAAESEPEANGYQ